MRDSLHRSIPDQKTLQNVGWKPRLVFSDLAANSAVLYSTMGSGGGETHFAYEGRGKRREEVRPSQKVWG